MTAPDLILYSATTSNAWGWLRFGETVIADLVTLLILRLFGFRVKVEKI